MLIIFIRGIVLYILVIFSIRLMGKRQIGDLSPSELVITILISNIATLAMEDSSLPLLTAVIPLFTLVCLDVLSSYLCMKSRKVRHTISGKPEIVISGGTIDQNSLRKLRYTIDDLMSALRTQGIFDISQVQYAVVETTGVVSAMLKPEFQPLTPNAAALPEPEPAQDPPQAIISDGDFIESVKNRYGVNYEDIVKQLKHKHLEVGDVFICTIDANGELKIVEKAKEQL